MNYEVVHLRKWEGSLEESEIFSWKKIKVNKHVEGVMASRDGGDSRIFEGGFSPWRKRTGSRGWRAASAVWIFLYRAEGHRRGDQRGFFFFGFWEKKAWVERKWEEKAKGRWQARQRRAKQRKDWSSQKRGTKGSFPGMIGSSMHGKGEVAPGFFSDVSGHRAAGFFLRMTCR